MFFNLLKGPTQTTQCSNLVPICPAKTEIWPNTWFYIIVTLKGQGHPWGQQYFSPQSTLYLWANLWSFIDNLLAVSLENLCKIFSKVARRKKEKKKKVRRNSLTDGDTLWRKLHHEGEIWRKSDKHMIWRSFLELLFGISWGSIHWAVIEIEQLKVCLKSTRSAIVKQR